ncbi:hypothetical protein BDK51DRAFT_33101 [Blyttiomyces helicus]|uniref:Uncharacterized protein n=1 Tax=Blyttiomyces helicus TaxID=388810 RepID=A0A4P9W026_9FUNG|nr:hypothetical protein BDK51DRAFT_33101 [Blyttiomyces helicus]|eukprot:RKO84423.1 hypothetical protein BDK51DRAFT_33101 [Blyttiomyces helicus]
MAFTIAADPRVALISRDPSPGVVIDFSAWTGTGPTFPECVADAAMWYTCDDVLRMTEFAETLEGMADGAVEEKKDASPVEGVGPKVKETGMAAPVQATPAAPLKQAEKKSLLSGFVGVVLAVVVAGVAVYIMLNI